MTINASLDDARIDDTLGRLAGCPLDGARRDRMGSAGWADAGLLAWSLREAAADYFEEQLNRKSGREMEG